MIMCSLNSVKKMFGGNTVFEDLSFEIQEKDRIGLVGRNGCGKSTILKLISGMEPVDAGAIHIKKGTKIGYLSQIPTFEDQTLGKDVLFSAFSEARDIFNKMNDIELKMSAEQNPEKLDSLIREYGNLQEKFIHLNGYEMDAKVSKVANGLKIESLLDTEFKTLSGGEQTKVCLGYMLLQQPDLLLLDEPTNHLDIGAVEWLEEFLQDYEGTVVIVSHDRYFLDEVANKILDLEDGEICLYHHNYSGFMIEKEKKLLDEFQSYQEQQRKIKKMKEAIKRLRDWANRSNPPSAALHKRATNMQRALDRMEKLKKPILERKKMGLEFEKADRSGKDVVLVKNASKVFKNKTLFENVNIHVQYKDRTAIVGDNGTGKSTLLKMILGDLKAETGIVSVGSNVKIGYLSQHLYTDNPNTTVLEAFREEIKVAEGEARHLLAKFLFYGPAVFRKVGQLSGGERMRLRLAQLMHQDLNLLILDEPTNHLDIDSREVLEDALEDFQGTILAVSHDRYLLNKLFDKTYWIHNKSMHFFEGPYQWAKKKLVEKLDKEPKQIITGAPKKQVSSNFGRPEKTKEKTINLDQLEKEIELVEEELLYMELSMQKESDLEALQLLYIKQKELEQKRDALYQTLESVLS
ncbi:ribosomal protection-like ABC-F family protein [Peribacillus alkalitolerans]|uniref:ribosomal protection-like ABC-F family protein n=1 Tax=Peribacillus alkalitolerans TaxID=1550385 RepID=UPI0013D864F3|nr:ABC-F type ribosomal protection protein [Peribacillus alkalitolerans]